MKLPQALREINQWTLVGPMGPRLSGALASHAVLAVDGGAHYTDKIDAWLGDGDSYQLTPPTQHIFRFPPEKDASDLALALKLFEDRENYQLHLWGFLGGRSDHELFNLGEALNFLKFHPRIDISFYNQNKLAFKLFGAGAHEFSCQGIFSLGCLEATQVKLTGDCRYPIVHPTQLLPLSSFGLSNHGHGKIFLNNKAPVFIYYAEEK